MSMSTAPGDQIRSDTSLPAGDLVLWSGSLFAGDSVTKKVRLKLGPPRRQLPVWTFQSRVVFKLEASGHPNSGPLSSLGQTQICRPGHSLSTTGRSKPYHLLCSPRWLRGCLQFRIERQRQPVSGPFRFGPIRGIEMMLLPAEINRARGNALPPSGFGCLREADPDPCPPLGADAASFPCPRSWQQTRPRVRHYPPRRSGRHSFPAPVFASLLTFIPF